MSRSLFYILTTGLILLGITLMLLRHADTSIPLLPGEKTTVWDIEAKVQFQPIEDTPIKVSLTIPNETPNFRLFLEQTASAGYGFSIVTNQGSRRGEWTARKADGTQTLYYKVQVVSDASSRIEQLAAPSNKFPAVIWQSAEALAAEEIIQTAFNKSSDNLSFTRELLKQLNFTDQTNQNLSLLLANHSQTELLAKIFNQAKIPARISSGLMLEDKRRNQSLTPLLEVFVNEKWHIFDPKTGNQGLPEGMLLWNQGQGSLIDVVGGRNAQVRFSMIKQNIPALDLAQAQLNSSVFNLFSIYQLPIEEQSVFKLLLLLPIGALITVFMRLMIGVRTSGTFMPVLIAMAFLQTALIPGLVNFISIVAIGLLLRSYLSSLNLLLVARIATIIIIVIFLIGLISLVGYQLGFNTGMTVAFFPIIILAWTIERMSILWEEEGPREVAVQGGGSLFVALLAYAAMQNTTIGHLMFNFPELNLAVVALIMLIGRYTGYRLLELKRFQAFTSK